MRNTKEYFGPQRVGGRYFNGYWGQTYTVLNIQPGTDTRGFEIKVQWEDGQITSHGTPWNSKRDSVL